MTGEEYLIARLQLLRAEARALADEEYDGEEMWRFVRDAAAMFERFLQTASLSNPPDDTNLYGLIEALEHDGVSVGSRDSLHAVRDAANKAKHDPQADTSYRHIDELLEGAEEAVHELAHRGIPEVARGYDPPYRRRFLIAVHDHFVGGESEFFIWPAGQEPRGEWPPPREIEIFQFEFRDEAKVRQRLDQTGDLEFGTVDADVVAGLKKASNYSEAGYWEGEYRDLVASCAPHQHDLPLLPGLARHEQAAPVSSALAMSVVDLLDPVPPLGDRPGEDDLLAHASMHYAVRRKTDVGARLAPAFVEFVASIPIQGAPLRGPRWLGPDRFEESSKSALKFDDSLGLALLDDGTLLVRLPED